MNQKNQADVSIVSANYNNGRYLSDFILSIQDSTLLPKELILIDDGSTDNSLEILENFLNLDYLKIIPLYKNRGFANALNIGIENASSKYILRLDPDDRIDKNRIEMQYQYLEKHTKIDMLGSNALYFDSISEAVVNKSNFPIGHKNILKRYTKGEHGLLHGTIMARSSVLKKFKYNQHTFPAEDYDLFARIIKEGYIFENLRDVLVKVRVHVSSTSNNIGIKTIKTTFDIRDKVFQKRTSKLKVYIYFGHIFFYRKYLFNKNSFLKYIYIILATLFYPKKAIRRLFS